MNKAPPTIKETDDEIREMLESEHQLRKQNRLQALYPVVLKQAKSAAKFHECQDLMTFQKITFHYF